MNADAKPAPKRRPWLQVHLSTCVILMFVAGALLWANARERMQTISVSEEGASTTEELVPGRNSEYLDHVYDRWIAQGWPWSFRASKIHPGVHLWEGGKERTLFPFPTAAEGRESVWGLRLGLDALVALAILAAVAAACEVWIRRRARRGHP